MTDTIPSHNETAGTKMLLADPKRAILKLAVPMMVAMVLLTAYNLVDAFWVAGLGADALAAVGFSFPLFFIVIGLGAGLGTGGGSAISRVIGARNKPVADSVATHTMLITVILTVAVTVPFYLLADPIFAAMGAGSATGMATGYARVLFLGTFFILFTNVAYAILRGEGDAKRPMYAMAVSSILNLILDPLLIYTCGMGVAGAAWATVASLAASSLIMAYWLFVKKDNYISFPIRDFTLDTAIVKDILRVGFPASMEQMTMALSTLAINGILVLVASTDGVAIYSVGWRVVSIGIMPLIAIATAVVAVTGASYGARQYPKMEAAHLYSIRLGLIIGVAISAAIFIFAPQIAGIFTTSEGAAHLAPDLTVFLRDMCIFFPLVGFGMFSSSLFQGVGRGINSLTVTILRTVVLTMVFVWTFAVSFGFGLDGVWWGIAAGNILGAATGFLWARRYTARLIAGAGAA